MYAIVSHSLFDSVIYYFAIPPVVVIEFVYNATVCSPVNIMEAIQTITEMIVNDSISCKDIDSDCILYESYVVISSLLFGKLRVLLLVIGNVHLLFTNLCYCLSVVLGFVECVPEQPVGTKCAQIDITVYLIPSNSTVPISTDDRELVIDKVNDALNGATGEDGEIYNELACPLYPSNQPSVELSRPPSMIPSMVPSLEPTNYPSDKPSGRYALIGTYEYAII